MNRVEWLTIYREMRSATRKAAYGAPACVRWYNHGGTYWTFRHDRSGFDASPSIIRDRAPAHRIACELHFAAEFRAKAKAGRGHTFGRSAQFIQGAKMFLDDARQIRHESSAFHKIAA